MLHEGKMAFTAIVRKLATQKQQLADLREELRQERQADRHIRQLRSSLLDAVNEQTEDKRRLNDLYKEVESISWLPHTFAFNDLQRHAIQMTWKKISSNRHRTTKMFTSVFLYALDRSGLAARLYGAGSFLQRIEQCVHDPQLSVARIRTKECSAAAHGAHMFDLFHTIMHKVSRSDPTVVIPELDKIVTQHACLFTHGFTVEVWEQMGAALVDIFLMQEHIQGCPEARRAWMHFFAYLVDQFAAEFNRQTAHQSRRRPRRKHGLAGIGGAGHRSLDDDVQQQPSIESTSSAAAVRPTPAICVSQSDTAISARSNPAGTETEMEALSKQPSTESSNPSDPVQPPSFMRTLTDASSSSNSLTARQCLPLSARSTPSSSSAVYHRNPRSARLPPKSPIMETIPSERTAERAAAATADDDDSSMLIDGVDCVAVKQQQHHIERIRHKRASTMRKQKRFEYGSQTNLSSAGLVVKKTHSEHPVVPKLKLTEDHASSSLDSQNVPSDPCPAQQGSSASVGSVDGAAGIDDTLTTPRSLTSLAAISPTYVCSCVMTGRLSSSRSILRPATVRVPPTAVSSSSRTNPPMRPVSARTVINRCTMSCHSGMAVSRWWSTTQAASARMSTSTSMTQQRRSAHMERSISVPGNFRIATLV